MEFIFIVTDLMKRKGVTKKKLTDDLGISKNSFQYWEKNGNIPSGAILQKIADYFGVSTDYLLGRDEKAPDPEEPDQEQDEVSMEFADRVSRLSDAGREALSQYLDLLLRSEGKP